MTHRRPARLPAALAVLAILALIGPPAAAAHAALVTATPADGATVAEPPAEIVMTFSQELDAGRSSIRLVNAADQVVAEGSSVGPQQKTMRLPVPAGLAPGTYTVRWTTFSTEDSEQERGTTTFTVARSTAAPPSAPTAAPSVPASASPAPASPAPSSAPSPSAPPQVPTASSGDALIPIVAVVIAILGLGMWLLRGRSRSAS